jgi:hypothetical protein
MKIITTLILILSVVGCSDENKSDAQTPTTNAKNEAKWESPKPTHLYSIEEEGEYGYEPGISDDDEKAGRKTKPLIMVRYLGVKDGTYTIQINDGMSTNTASCKYPCEFIKQKTFFNGSVVDTQTVRAVQGSIIWAIMQDAQNDQMKPYLKRNSNQ